MIQIRQGDCKEVLLNLEVGAIICDPPYGLAFAGNDWDTFGRIRPYVHRVDNPKSFDEGRAWGKGYSRGGLNRDVVLHKQKAAIVFEVDCLEWLKVAYGALQPGGVIKAFGGTRTFHRLAAAMEDAGFTDIHLEAWGYRSGFPKSMDVSKAIDANITIGNSNSVALRARDGRKTGTVGTNMGKHRSAKNDCDQGVEAAPLQTDAARQWKGWGTALKPAWEPVVVGRKS